MYARRLTKHRIVVGVDDHPASRAALRWAHQLAAATGGTVEAVHTWTPYPPYGWIGSGWTTVAEGWDPKQDAARHLRRLVTETLGEEALQKGASPPVRLTVWPGPAGGALVNLSEGAELLVVGTRGHSNLGSYLGTSVSAHCVEHATCPVLVVHEGMDPDLTTPTETPPEGAHLVRHAYE